MWSGVEISDGPAKVAHEASLPCDVTPLPEQHLIHTSSVSSVSYSALKARLSHMPTHFCIITVPPADPLNLLLLGRKLHLDWDRSWILLRKLAIIIIMLREESQTRVMGMIMLREMVMMI